MSKPIVLIVDDDVLVANSLTRSLANQYQVLTANTGEQALEFLKKFEVAVILTDQRMPGVTGTQLIEKSRELRPDALGILISGYSDVTALIDALNIGTFRGFIPKPWDNEALREKISEAIQEYQVIFNEKQLLSDTSKVVENAKKEVGELRKMMDQLIEQQLATIFLKENSENSQTFYRNGLNNDTNRVYLDNLENGLLILNADGIIRYHNPGFSRLLAGEDDLNLQLSSNTPILEQRWCRENDVFFDSFNSVMNGEFVLANLNLSDPDGTLRYYELTATPVPFTKDKYNAIAILQDRTTEKKTLHYLTALNTTTKIVTHRNDIHSILKALLEIFIEALSLDAVFISIITDDPEVPPLQFSKTKSTADVDNNINERSFWTSLFNGLKDHEAPWVIKDISQAVENYAVLKDLGDYHTAILARIRFHQTSNGVLILATTNLRKFTDDDVAFIRTMISQLEAALINKEWQTELVNQANRDPLTGLNNRRTFMAQASIACEKMIHETNGKACILMIDVDNFKLFNDQYGHLTGDKILRAIATVLLESTRTTDIVARFGGDEFIIFLSHCDSYKAKMIMGRIKEHLSNLDIPEFHIEDKHRKVTVSIGLATTTSKTFSTLDKFIEAADRAMYQQKQVNQQ